MIGQHEERLLKVEGVRGAHRYIQVMSCIMCDKRSRPVMIEDVRVSVLICDNRSLQGHEATLVGWTP